MHSRSSAPPFSRTHRAPRSSALRFLVLTELRALRRFLCSPTHRAPLAPASVLATAYLTSLHVLRRVSKATRAKNTLHADHHAALVVRTEQLLSLSQYTPALRFSVFWTYRAPCPPASSLATSSSRPLRVVCCASNAKRREIHLVLPAFPHASRRAHQACTNLSPAECLVSGT